MDVHAPIPLRRTRCPLRQPFRQSLLDRQAARVSSVAMSHHIHSALLFAYTPECYPTEIRNSGAGLVYGVGRLANVFGPLFVALLFTRYGYASVFIYIATCWVLVAVTVGGFGPRTKGKPLV